MTTTTVHVNSSSRLATAALVTGLLAALLTTLLAFLALVLGAATFVLGGLALRRHSAGVRAPIGMAMAAVSVYVIVLEIAFVG